ncbi:MAG: hypothetical protein ACK4KW_01800, partial [Gemmobacter sp.]
GGEAMRRLLSPEGFDLPRVLEMIEESTLDPVRKTTLRTLVEGAADNPALLESALAQLREALGL